MVRIQSTILKAAMPMRMFLVKKKLMRLTVILSQTISRTQNLKL